QARQPPRPTVGPPEPVPDVSAGLPVGLIEPGRRDDASLASLPRQLVRSLLRELLRPGVVRRVAQVRRLSEPRDQPPLAHNDFPYTFAQADERSGAPWEDRGKSKRALGRAGPARRKL